MDKSKTFRIFILSITKQTITMDSRLTQLKEVKDKLRVEIQKEDTKVHLALANLHKEEQKEKQKIFNQAFNSGAFGNLYHWDGQRVYFSKEDKDADYHDCIATLEVREEYNWDRNEGEPKHYYQLKFGYYGANNFDPSETFRDEVVTLLKKHKAQEHLLQSIADGVLDELKVLTKTYSELRKSAQESAEEKKRLDEELRTNSNLYEDILTGLFVEGFEFEVKGDWVKYAGREGYYKSDVSIGNNWYYRVKKITIDKVTPKQISFTISSGYDVYDKETEQYVDRGDTHDHKLRKNKDKVFFTLKRLYQDFFKTTEELENY